MKTSRIYNQALPADMAAAVRKAGIDPASAWLVTTTDLNLQGRYEKVFLAADADRLITIGRDAAGRPDVRVNIERPALAEVRTRRGVGGGFLETLINDVYVEIAAYSNAYADTFYKTTAKLKVWAEGEQPAFTTEDDENPRVCSTCGMPLEFKGDLCRRCMKRGAAFMRVLKLMRPYTGRAVVMMILVVIGIALGLLPQQLVRFLIDHVLAPVQAGNPILPADQVTSWLLGLVAALLSVHVLQMVTNMFNGRMATFVGTQITYDMRSRVFSHLTRLGIGYYDRYNVGQLMTRVAGDTEQMKGFVHQLTTGFLAQIITVISVGAVLFSLNWKLALLTLVPAPVVIGLAIFFWKRIYPRYYRVWDANSKLSGVLNTILSGIRVVKAFGQERRECDRFGRSSGYVRDSFRRVEYAVTTFNPSITLLFHLGGIMVWYLGGRMVLGQQLTLGTLTATIGYIWMFYTPLSQLTQLTNWLSGFLTASQRVFELLDTTPQIMETATPVPLPCTGGGIVFENVSFGYNRHEPVLRGVSLTIGPGEHVGIVGKSGSGKTTLVNLIARFYDADEGRILIDGTDVCSVKIGELRSYVGVVLQESFLFRGTIRENITYGRTGATPDEIITAAKAAHAHDFILRHPLGYDTYIGERGAGLSGGERQRISIARALLYNPSILILDEATSNVDTESEQLIQKALERVTAGRTSIAIAHRLSTLRQCDRIIVMDNGRILEQGSHPELMARQGLYYRLVKIQTELSSEPNIDLLAARKDEDGSGARTVLPKEKP